MTPSARQQDFCLTTRPQVRYQRFPARADQASRARRLLAGILDSDQRADDALVCLSELVSNAIVHSRSRQPGGSFTVRVQMESQRLRVEVCDQGGPWQTPTRAFADEESGRGLLIVSQLATRWGCGGYSQTGWNVWFEIDGHLSGQDER
jgi:anti-sigma regulatory factor (Ser/Thr protein kinase)